MSEVAQIMNEAISDGLLSSSSQATLSNFPDLNAQIQQGLGVTPDEIATKDVVLVSMLIDDSGSIRFASQSDAVRQGHNLVLDSIQESKQEDNVLVHVRYLNGTVLTPYVRVQDAAKMTTHNYNPNGGTPLYDETVVFLASIAAKYQEFQSAAVPCRCITLIVTDGVDEHSYRSNDRDVKHIVTDLLKTEDHIIATMGIGDDKDQWDPVFEGMGIPEDWRLTPSTSGHDIRAAFSMFSKSAVRVSQSGVVVSQVGGFI